MGTGFTTNANDKTDWKYFRIFRALVLTLICENSLQDIQRTNPNKLLHKRVMCLQNNAEITVCRSMSL